MRYIDPLGLDTLGFGTAMPDNPKDGQFYIDDDWTIWQYTNGNWRGGIKAVDIWGEGRGGSGGGMIGSVGNAYFQEMMNRHNELLAYMSAQSNARWEAMQAQLRLEEALNRAQAAQDNKHFQAMWEKARELERANSGELEITCFQQKNTSMVVLVL